MGRRMTDDKSDQVQSALSARGTKRDVENNLKCIRTNFILARQSSVGLGPSKIKMSEIAFLEIFPGVFIPGE